MITLLANRRDGNTLHYKVTHIDHHIHPSRSWTLAEGLVAIPPRLTAQEAARKLWEALVGLPVHEAPAPFDGHYGEQLELFQCLPGSHQSAEPRAATPATRPRLTDYA